MVGLRLDGLRYDCDVPCKCDLNEPIYYGLDVLVRQGRHAISMFEIYATRPDIIQESTKKRA